MSTIPGNHIICYNIINLGGELNINDHEVNASYWKRKLCFGSRGDPHSNNQYMVYKMVGHPTA